jgi:hypothetical protein
VEFLVDWICQGEGSQRSGYYGSISHWWQIQRANYIK